jgi:hypothetical protein
VRAAARGFIALLPVIVGSGSPAQETYRADNAQYYSAPHEGSAEGAIVKLAAVTNAMQPSTAEQAADNPQEQERWWNKAWRHWVRRFVADAKITDAVVAIATLFLAIFTARLWVSTNRMWEATKRSVDIARDEFTSSHPPKIVVRRVSLDRGSIAISAPIARPWKIQYIVANVGRGNATIFEGNATVKEMDNPLPAIPPFDDDGNFPIELHLAAGESMPLTVQIDFTGPIITQIRLGETANAAQGDEAGNVHFFGYIQYRDNIGVVRRTAFCRRYDIRTRRFNFVDDPDYEYGD